MKTPLRWLFLLLVHVSVLGNPPVATAQEELKTVRSLRYVLAPEELSQFWIGVIAVPTDDVLKSHLGLKSGLVVREVVADSPAAQAGLKKHDILLQFGDKQLTDLKGLIQAVEETGEKAVEVRLLRGGKEQELEMTPVDRPENERALLGSRIEEEPLRGILHSRFLRPALTGEIVDVPKLAAGRNMPRDVTVIIKKEGEGPAAITVQRDSDDQDVIEEKLGELPEDVRLHVEKLLNRAGGNEARSITIRALTLGLPKDKTDVDVEVRGQGNEEEDGEKKEGRRRRTRAPNRRIELVPQAGGNPEDLLKKLRTAVADSDLNDLRKEIQALRQDVDALKRQLHVDDEEEIEFIEKDVE